MKNLADLHLRQEMLRQEISALEEKLSFKNPKESLGAFTDGFTDAFFTDKTDAMGKHHLGVKSQKICCLLTEKVLKWGFALAIGKQLKKGAPRKKWKKRLLGIALLFLSPYCYSLIKKKG